MNSKKISKLVVSALEDVKGQSIQCINVEKLTAITEYMVIVTGSSNTHLKAMADAAVKKVKEAGVEVIGVEGRQQSEWILVDFGGVVLHLMMASVRVLYNLEELWSFKVANSETEETAKHEN